MTFALLLIDPQNDFITGTLQVPGAIEDTQRTIQFINANIQYLDAIYVTQDWHNKEHIAHATWWQDAEGNAPQNFTTITAENVETGKWIVANKNHEAHSLEYLKALESGGKYKHTIWPEHCIQDTDGANLPDNLQQALQQWERDTSKKVTYIKKGMNTKTEQFSALRAEVPQVEDPATELNTELIRSLDGYDRVFVAGQALSHCVAASTMDLIAEGTGILPTKVTLLTDCCSNVAHCESLGDAFIGNAVKKGVTLTKSTVTLGTATKLVLTNMFVPVPTDGSDNTRSLVLKNGSVNNTSDEEKPLLDINQSKSKSCCVLV